jgi:DNA-binding GntR family transcriptional regulator
MPRTKKAVVSRSRVPRPPASRRPAQSARDAAYFALKQLIVRNEIPAGAQMLEQEAAQRLGMSRTPVREAMIRLEREGIVELRSRHGMRVLPISAADMQEIYEVLTALESTAAAIVAARGLDDTKLSELRSAVDEMDQALSDDDLLRWSQADERFHLLLVEMSGNNRIRNFVGQVWEQSNRARLLTLRLRPKPTGSNKDHAALVDAIARRDPEAAKRIHENHRQRAGRMLTSLLAEHGLKQL